MPQKCFCCQCQVGVKIHCIGKPGETKKLESYENVMFRFIIALRRRERDCMGLEEMGRTIRRYKLGYVLGAILCFIGLVALAIVVWDAWPHLSSSVDPMSTFWTFLWEEQLNLIPGVESKPMYFITLAAATLISGAAVLAFSRQWFFLPGETKKLQCPFCRKQWIAGFDRGQVVCPHCNHVVHPRLIEK